MTKAVKALVEAARAQVHEPCRGCENSGYHGERCPAPEEYSCGVLDLEAAIRAVEGEDPHKEAREALEAVKWLAHSLYMHAQAADFMDKADFAQSKTAAKIEAAVDAQLSKLANEEKQ